ncbi:MAG: GMC family oxidoreductase, partial [Candidatus Eremiobacteraeota bacterium]|nr:GMC family oxidoreductase [Candidatus Eremiobacteraeota bacterium]
MLTRAQEQTLATVVAGFAPADADIDAAAALVSAAVARLPRHKQQPLAFVLTLLGSPLGGLLLAGRARGVARLDADGRERALRRLGTLRPLRPAFDAFSRLALFAAYAAADANGKSAVWDRLGYPGPRHDAPASEPLAVETAAAGRLSADAVVVGSGAGGGVAAALLAQAGLRVVILEAGPPFEAVAARQREAEAFAELYLEAGLCATDDLTISVLAGACVGGGTTVNWSTSLRLPPALAASWSAALGRPAFAAELADAYDAVETRLGVTLARGHNRNNGVIAAGCAALGWNVRALPRNADCEGDQCGYCGFGCAYDRKRGTARTYLCDAAEHGARLIANAPVERVLIENGAATGVVARVSDGRELVVDAPLVVVAAGTLRTPGILARSGVRSPHLGRHLHLHPTSAIAAEFAEPIESWHGAMQSAICDRFSDLRAGFGAAIEAAPAHPGLMALASPWAGRDAHAQQLSRARNLATLISLTRDRGEGSISLDERAAIRYAIAPDDAQHLAEGLAGATRIAFAAGALRVQTLHADGLALDRADATPAGLDAFAAELRTRARARHHPQLFSAHQMGTARMAASAADGVVDPDGRVYGVVGLLVADASVFPNASGVNPMLTIMA